MHYRSVEYELLYVIISKVAIGEPCKTFYILLIAIQYRIVLFLSDLLEMFTSIEFCMCIYSLIPNEYSFMYFYRTNYTVYLNIL